MEESRLVQYMEFTSFDFEYLDPVTNKFRKIVRQVSSEGVEHDLANAPRQSLNYRTFVRQEYTAPDGEVLVGERRDVSSVRKIQPRLDIIDYPDLIKIKPNERDFRESDSREFYK